ncbi:DUF7504 family protein [Haladaptatus sp. ZSTT2]|uniref:DUF7504 family protein n=1 Tax=Haladaptatus sp. ZSTT2 TaxID=3120515 RepID=UPI003FA528F1
MSQQESQEQSLHSTLADTANILLCTPPMSPAADDSCMELLTPPTETDVNVLWVAYSRTPDNCLTHWHQHGNTQPADISIINVGDSVRSASAATGGGGPGPIQTVASAGDLTGLGIAISNVLSQWAETDAQTVVCFDSLTALLQYVEPEKAYEFLHVLTGQLFAADAIAHFHISPDAHDDQTVAMLRSLFDAEVSITEDDDRIVLTR